jgi:two-component system response regulator DesR
MLRLGAATFLKIQLGCEICAQALDGREALKLAETTRPDVAVIDIGLPCTRSMNNAWVRARRGN